MTPRTYSINDGLTPVDLLHCGLDHITAAQLLFGSEAGHFDSAGYLAHIGVELLLKGWLLQMAGQFEGTHHIATLYSHLEAGFGAPNLTSAQIEIVKLLDGYEKLRYPNVKKPTEVGEDDWQDIEDLVGFICRSMPKEIPEALEQVEFGRKGGRILMQKKITT